MPEVLMELQARVKLCTKSWRQTLTKIALCKTQRLGLDSCHNAMDNFRTIQIIQLVKHRYYGSYFEHQRISGN